MTRINKPFPPCAHLSGYVNGEITNEVGIQTDSGKTLVFIFYPYDFTFVCPTEIKGFNAMKEEFEKEGAEVLLVSCDSAYSHKAWCEDKEGGIFGNTLPMLSDMNGALSKKLGIYVKKEGRPCRATFIVQNGVVVYEVVHADPIGRSSKEVLRVLKALNFQKCNGGVCPLDWE
ncbi:peroxiredoxin 2/4 [Nematocida sp. AWRm77]|nr:peroxiredoxin 2/4 [Nematocida sp. AWRm77]